MSLYETISDYPDRDTDSHRRTLYAETHTDSGVRIMSTGDDEWIESDTYRANFL